jgi:endonuclease-8
VPEGDTLRKAELRIAPLLEGRTLEHVWFRRTPALVPRAGQTVETVRAVGKHLLIELDRGLTIDTHLGMTGWWSTLPRERTPRPGSKLRLALTVADGHALCYAAPTVRTYARDGRPTAVDALGPDLSDAAPDLDAVLARIDRFSSPDRPVADALLDQRVAAGIGNVFKSEALFAVGVHPLTPIGALDAQARRRLWTVAHRQLRVNAGPGARRTTPLGHGLAVYGRQHGGCLRCDAAIEYAPAGPDASSRSSYWCPVCQPRAS